MDETGAAMVVYGVLACAAVVFGLVLAYVGVCVLEDIHNGR
jgi:Flp pilus assembly pilin Flp